MKVILLNGPKYVGKDTAAKQFCDLVNIEGTPASAVVMPMAKPMKLAALTELLDNLAEQGVYGGSPKDCYEIFERAKDEPMGTATGALTPRQLYIEYGTMLRRTKGEDAVADLWLKDAAVMYAEAIKTGLPEYLVVPDCRFLPEYDAACKLVGVKNVALVEMQRDGCTWDDDIGAWLFEHISPSVGLLNPGLIPSLTLQNHEHGLDRLGEALSVIVHQWENGAEYVSRLA